MFPRKYRIHAILILTFLFIIIYPQYSNKPDKDKTATAAAAALEFLQLVGAGQIDDSWNISAEYLRETVPLADWTQKMAEIRAKYGPIVAREPTDASFSAPVDDLPDSEIIILTYASTFERQQEATETVSLLLTADKGWQVVGYFIK